MRIFLFFLCISLNLNAQTIKTKVANAIGVDPETGDEIKIQTAGTNSIDFRKYAIAPYKFGNYSSTRYIFTFQTGKKELSPKQITFLKKIALDNKSKLSQTWVRGHASTLKGAGTDNTQLAKDRAIVISKYFTGLDPTHITDASDLIPVDGNFNLVHFTKEHTDSSQRVEVVIHDQQLEENHLTNLEVKFGTNSADLNWDKENFNLIKNFVFQLTSRTNFNNIKEIILEGHAGCGKEGGCPEDDATKGLGCMWKLGDYTDADVKKAIDEIKALKDYNQNAKSKGKCQKYYGLVQNKGENEKEFKDRTIQPFTDCKYFTKTNYTKAGVYKEHPRPDQYASGECRVVTYTSTYTEISYNSLSKARADAVMKVLTDTYKLKSIPIKTEGKGTSGVNRLVVISKIIYK